MGLPAARATDFHLCPSVQPSTHIGGPIRPPCATTVMIANQPAARVTDRLDCSCAIDTITQGSTTVTIEGKLAARMTDPCVEGIIIGGEATVLIGGPRGKQALEDIVNDYQVQSGNMVSWAPEFLGIDLADARQLTEREVQMLDDLGYFNMNDMNNIKENAENTANTRYPTPAVIPAGAPRGGDRTWRMNDGHRDAFRHAYWNSLMTREFGEEWTRQFTTAHEGVPDNPAIREAMDLYNNQVGRAIAAHNPSASDEQLANLIQQAVERGDLLVIDRAGKLAWSNQVLLWEHGETPNTPGMGGHPIPDGTADPNGY